MDSVCLKVGIHGLPPPIAVSGSSGCFESRSTPPSQMTATAVARSFTPISFDNPSLSSRGRNVSPWGFSFRLPLESLQPKGGGGPGKNSYAAALAVEDAVLVEDKEETAHSTPDNQPASRNGNWIFNILNVKSLWRQQGLEEHRGDIRIGGALLEEGNRVTNENVEQVGESSSGGDEDCDVCALNYSDDHENFVFDKGSFSKLLRRVSLAEARLYAQMSDLGNLAYSIPQIKRGDLLRDYGLRFVTSSLERKEQRMKSDEEKSSSPGSQHKEQQESANVQKSTDEPSAKAQGIEGNRDEHVSAKDEKVNVNRITAAAAYQIAASYMHSRTKSILLFKSLPIWNANKDTPENTQGVNMINEGVASVMASTDSVTAVVAAGEEVKQAVADDLNSAHSSPCDWFICDDDQNATRFFVIQGSESMASWQANLLFEPVKFEGFDVLVHRGIYEAAKGIYEQMLPEVHSHLKSHGKRASFRFTGHSLGGSLSLLINLMLLIRRDVPSSSLLPVITFGAPTVMCGGDSLLHKLRLPRSHLKAITMHRDIVPRAFSCHYPNHVAEFLKAVNGNFRTLPCLTKQKLLYAPMGEFLILQPAETFSPSHDLLPSGSGLYSLSCSAADASKAEKEMKAATAVFLNSPHPLEILSDRAAYGPGGTIQRDHYMGSYLKSVKNVIKEEEELIRRRGKHDHRDWWRLLASGGIDPGIMRVAEESLKRFSSLVASQRMHLIVVLLFPARLLILGALSVVSFREQVGCW